MLKVRSLISMVNALKDKYEPQITQITKII